MKRISFSGKVFKYGGAGGWYFVGLPTKLSQEIKESYPAEKKVGWSYIKVKATIGKTSWETTLFPTKEGPLLIAIKKNVRYEESIDADDTVKVTCSLL
jgi:hypothetical protein